MAWPWAPKWDPATLVFSEATLNTNFSINTTAPLPPDLYRRYIDNCVGATSSTREEPNQFITAVSSIHLVLKYTWEICDTSLAFLDIKASVEGNGLCTSVHYKPTDSHSYLLYSSSHSSHVKNSIPYSQFLRLRRLSPSSPCFPLLGLTPSGLFMGLSSTIIYTSELILWFHYLCSQCYAAQHSYVPLLSLRRDSPSKIVPDFLCLTL